MNQVPEVGEVNNSSHGYGGTYSGISGSRHRHKDESTLAGLGKKQVLKVNAFQSDSVPSDGDGTNWTDN